MRAPTATTPGTAACCPGAISSPSPIRAGRRAAQGLSIDMSLLLEALKKAEKAKEEAQRRARGEQGGASGDLKLEDAADAKPVMTRAELPDIRQPLEILSDDIRPKAAPGARAETPPPAAPQ